MMLILWGSAALSAIVDNIPFVATMAPVVDQLVSPTGPFAGQNGLWWALVLGADLGGNATAIGASANVVVTGIAMKSGHPIIVLGVHQVRRRRRRGHPGDRHALPAAALLSPANARRGPGLTTNGSRAPLRTGSAGRYQSRSRRRWSGSDVAQPLSGGERARSSRQAAPH